MLPLIRLAALSLTLAVCSLACAQEKVILLRETLGVDADRTLGCKRGVDPTFISGDNSTRLEAELSSTTRRYSTFIPGGDWELPSTVSTDNTWGGSLFGAGGLSSDLGDTHYTFGGSAYGSPNASRLIWKGSDNGIMVDMLSGGSTIAGLNFQGCRVAGAGPEPTGGTYPSRAKVGLHIRPSDDGGAGMNSAKCNLDHLAFYQIHTGILIGKDLVDADVGDETFTGEDTLHADSIYATDLHFYHPASGSKAGLGSCVHIRNSQSVSNVFEAIYSSGDPAQIFYLERGGKTHVGLISSSGDGIAVRVGLVNVNQGGLTIGHIAIDGNTTGKLLKGDVYTASIATPYCEIQSACVPVGVTAVPQVDVGPGTWVIKNTNYLRANSIKLTGYDNGTSWRVCHVHLENVTTVDCNLEELVAAASDGPYMLTWRNCHRYHDGASDPNKKWGLPFEDSTASTRIEDSGYNITDITATTP